MPSNDAEVTQSAKRNLNDHALKLNLFQQKILTKQIPLDKKNAHLKFSFIDLGNTCKIVLLQHEG